MAWSVNFTRLAVYCIPDLLVPSGKTVVPCSACRPRPLDSAVHSQQIVDNVLDTSTTKPYYAPFCDLFFLSLDAQVFAQQITGKNMGMKGPGKAGCLTFEPSTIAKYHTNEFKPPI